MNKNFERESRGRWMATEGRQLYHDWLIDLIARHRHETKLESLPLFDKDVGYNTVRSNLHHFGIELVNELMNIEMSLPETERHLLRSISEIAYYTSADDFMGERGMGVAVVAHARDGLQFAAASTIGMALEAARAMNVAVVNRPRFYELIADIMQTPSFHAVLEQYATTGFAVLASDAQSKIEDEKRVEHIGAILGMDVTPTSIIRVDYDTDGSPLFRLDADLKKALIRHMRSQNQKTYTFRRPNHSYAIMQRYKEALFTSGCPVRKAPDSEDTSAIGLLSGYLGEQTRCIIARRLHQRQEDVRPLGRAAATF